MALVSRPRRRIVAVILGGIALTHLLGGSLSAEILFRDDFNGSLSTEWSILRRDPSLYQQQSTTLDLMADSGDLWMSSNDAQNVFLIGNPTEGDFSVTMHLSFVPTSLTNAPQIALLAYDDDDNHVRCGYGSFSSLGPDGGPYVRALELATEINRTFTYDNDPRDHGSEMFYLRLEKVGNVYTQYSSIDGITYLQANDPMNYGDGSPTRLGFVAMVEKSTPSVAHIDYFEVNEMILSKMIIWDQGGPGNWHEPRWIGDLMVPEEQSDVMVIKDVVTIDSDAVAKTLDVPSGQLLIEPTGTLTVSEGMSVSGIAAIDLAGTLNASSLTTSGTHTIRPGATLAVTNNLTVNSPLDATSGTLAPAGNVVVNQDGTLLLSHALHADTLAVAGSVDAVGAEVATLDVSEVGQLHLSADAVATDVTVNGGTLRLTDGARLNATTMHIDPQEGTAGTTVDTGMGHIEVGESLVNDGGASYAITDGTFQIQGANLADPDETCTITLSGGLLTMPGGIIPSGAIAHWKLDEGSGSLAVDSSLAGNDHYGTITGAGWVDDPQRGTVLSFDGAGDAVQIANPDDLVLSYPNTSTVAMWVNTSQKGVDLLGEDDANGMWFLGEKALYLHPTNGAVTLTGPGGGTLAGTTDVADGQWHHVAVTYNGSTEVGDQEIYVDGVLDTSLRGYSAAHIAGSLFRLGASDSNKSQDFVGIMDDVYFYDRSLNAVEVADLFSAPSGVHDLSNTNILVVADTAVYAQSAQNEVIFGDLTLDAGVALSIAGAAVRVHDFSGGQLAAVTATLTVAGTLSPGNSPGRIDVVGLLSLEAESVYEWELGPSSADLVAVEGDLTLADGWTLRLVDAGGLCNTDDQLDLFTCSGLLTMGQATIDASAVEGLDAWDVSGATIAQDGNRVYLTGLTVVPEPSSLALLLAGGLAGLALLRRRSLGR